MKFISIRELKTRSAKIWKDLPSQQEMVLTSNGRPIALLATINDDNLEQVLTAFRIARATNTVASIQYESELRGTHKMTMEEINSEIKAARSDRKQ